MIVSYQGGLEVMRRVLCTRRNKEVAGGSAFTRPCGAWPCGFSVMWPQRRVRAVPCLHRSRASAGGMQGKMNRCGHPVPPSRLP